MKPIVLLINPNTSQETTAMMHRVARTELPSDFLLESHTATRGSKMITTPEDLAISEEEVIQLGLQHASHAAAIVIGAFGDPGLDALQSKLSIPVVGIGESSIGEASAKGRRFGIATTTPDLGISILEKVKSLGLSAQFTGCRIPPGDPTILANHPDLQDERLAHSVSQSIEQDGAQAVVIGGGPLSESARRLASRFQVPIISPIAASMHRVAATLAYGIG
jgi:allantoin racemase